ncbi:hypothetical protein TREVI0001_1554 [Treponema vincentii ATCC 35580]|uniref:Uncharacterized protein n=1 Tax=Treponema vincentii ATCC 35580 TaxID=596324 RepID=C8PN50_9SPIR|nr:hypothetical protein TREVI0001_1554 [Treponema vincentii ATCC 35580]
MRNFFNKNFLIFPIQKIIRYCSIDHCSIHKKLPRLDFLDKNISKYFYYKE